MVNKAKNLKQKIIIYDVENKKKIEVSVDCESELYVTITNKDTMTIYERLAGTNSLIPVIEHPLDHWETTFVIKCEKK